VLDTPDELNDLLFAYQYVFGESRQPFPVSFPELSCVGHQTTEVHESDERTYACCDNNDHLMGLFFSQCRASPFSSLIKLVPILTVRDESLVNSRLILD
jgi:hypothetical protein